MKSEKLMAERIREVEGLEAMQLERLRDEFAVHAPPVPEWYMRQLFGYATQIAGDGDRQFALTRWPWCYADLVLSARKPQP